MGWTYMHRDKGTSNKDFFQEDFDAGTKFHAHGTVNGVFYAAVETPRHPGEVWALVALTNWVPSEYHNFGFKDMSEEMGPYEHRAPLSVLNALTPTDHPAAMEWRERVAQYHEQRAALRGLRDGDQIVLGTPLPFTDGQERGTFTVRRQAIRGGRTKVVLTDGGFQRFSLPNWQDMTVAVLRGGERVETPLSLRRKENEYVNRVEGLCMRASAEVRAALVEHYGVDAKPGVLVELRHLARQEFRRGDVFDLVAAEAEGV